MRHGQLLRTAATVVVSALAAIALSFVALKWLPEQLVAGELRGRDRAADLGRVRTATLALLAGGIAVIGALYTARTFRLSRRGQLSDRFTRAIDQLGADNLDVRLGGIYALEQVARESPSDHITVMEVLTAYVRQHSPWPPVPSEETPRRTQQRWMVRSGRLRWEIALEHSAEAGATAEQLDSNTWAEPPEAPADIKAVLRVLARRETRHERGQPFRVDLRYTNLRGVVAPRLDAQHGNLEGAQLQDAVLNKARLQHAWLADAKLIRTQLIQAELREAHLRGASLLGAMLALAKLRDAWELNTEWPVRFDPKAAGVRHELDWQVSVSGKLEPTDRMSWDEPL